MTRLATHLTLMGLGIVAAHATSHTVTVTETVTECAQSCYSTLTGYTSTEYLCSTSAVPGTEIQTSGAMLPITTLYGTSAESSVLGTSTVSVSSEGAYSSSETSYTYETTQATTEKESTEEYPTMKPSTTSPGESHSLSSSGLGGTQSSVMAVTKSSSAESTPSSEQPETPRTTAGENESVTSSEEITTHITKVKTSTDTVTVPGSLSEDTSSAAETETSFTYGVTSARSVTSSLGTETVKTYESVSTEMPTYNLPGTSAESSVLAVTGSTETEKTYESTPVETPTYTVPDTSAESSIAAVTTSSESSFTTQSSTPPATSTIQNNTPSSKVPCRPSSKHTYALTNSTSPSSTTYHGSGHSSVILSTGSVTLETSYGASEAATEGVSTTYDVPTETTTIAMWTDYPTDVASSVEGVSTSIASTSREYYPYPEGSGTETALTAYTTAYPTDYPTGAESSVDAVATSSEYYPYPEESSTELTSTPYMTEHPTSAESSVEAVSTTKDYYPYPEPSSNGASSSPYSTTYPSNAESSIETVSTSTQPPSTNGDYTYALLNPSSASQTSTIRYESSVDAVVTSCTSSAKVYSTTFVTASKTSSEEAASSTEVPEYGPPEYTLPVEYGYGRKIRGAGW